MTTGRRLTRRCSRTAASLAAGGAGILLALSLGTLPLGAVGAPPPGLWTGQGHAVRTASLPLVSITTTYDSEFWFVVTDRGDLEGEATVSYNLVFNDANLRSLIVATHWSTNYSLASVPAVGGLLNSALLTNDLVGMRMQYQEFAPIRRGRIIGRLADGRLHVRWAEPMRPIPYQDYAVYPMRSKPSKAATHPAYPPWIGDADVSEPLKGRFIASTSEQASAYHNDEVTISSVWSAVRQP
jgi:hypothetical protein